MFEDRYELESQIAEHWLDGMEFHDLQQFYLCEQLHFLAQCTDEELLVIANDTGIDVELKEE